MYNFFIEMSLTQWVLDFKDWNDPRLSDVQRVFNYLKRYPEELPQVTIPYIFQHYRKALSNDQIFHIMQKRIQKRGAEAAEHLYHLLENKKPEILQTQVIITMLSLGSPILFWKYFNPSGARVHHELNRPLYTALTQTQRKTYAPAALRLSGYLLEYLTAKQKTKQLCMIAVNTDGAALRLVPETKRSNAIVEAAVSQSASAMEFASLRQRIKFIEIAVMGSGRICDHHRQGAFSGKDWSRPWAKEVWDAIGLSRKKELHTKWRSQCKQDENDWHNDYASR